MSYCKLLIFLALLSISRCATEIPSFLKICHRNDLRLNECVNQSVEALKPYLSGGIPEFDVPPCEPLKIQKLNMHRSEGTVAIKSSNENIVIKGATNFVLKKVNVNLKKDQIQLEIFFPEFSMTSDYKINGKILMIPIKGEGQLTGNFSDINADIMIQGERYQNNIDNNTYYRICDVLIDFDVGNASVHLDKLFNGDQTLSSGMNLFLKDNWKIITEDIKPGIADNIADLLKKYSEKIFSKYSLDVLLPA
ncbi:GSCOCG00008207001-RA-CDS [Cotesia congregata]|uniref:Similar to dyw: Circadian clock-controlled protein daywake (Drosophila melanogaster) n=1 Tax=Cotesia congregata TaxID=51543 RepID=A0A8J2HT88_COTCN|nr:GSCOCG00008207001-RA-CDS [Cotesia congregata]CAG5107893.1 Similar to dyw: Circadian clock-controlled protein daywake (Drosophila melanogaster) [Cotesia congregata]